MRIGASIIVALTLSAWPAGAQVTEPYGIEPNVTPEWGEDRISLRPIVASAIEGSDVYNERGGEIGEVDRVVIGPDKRAYAVISFGGFWDIGDEDRVVPLSRMYMRNGELILPGVTEAEVENLDTWTDVQADYADVDDAYRTDLRVVGPVPTAAPDARRAPPLISVEAIRNMDVYNERGEELGDVDRVVLGRDRKIYAVVSFGGFWGIGDKDRVISMERMYISDGRLILPGVTEAEVERMPPWRGAETGYTPINDYENLTYRDRPDYFTTVEPRVSRLPDALAENP